MKKYIKYLFLASFLLVFFIPSDVFAVDILASQTVDTATTTALNLNISKVSQRLGNGFSGNVDLINQKVYKTASGAGSLILYLFECDDVSYSTGCNNVLTHSESAGSVPIDTEYTIQAVFDPYTMDPDKFYYTQLHVNSVGTSARFRVYGSLTNEYSGGACLLLTSGSACPTASTSMLDVYFYLYGNETQSPVVDAYPTEPEHLEVTPTTNVDLSFDYLSSPVYGIDSYVIELLDLTAGITLTPLTGTLVPASGSVTRNVNLTSGHTYKYTPSILNSSAPTVLYGSHFIYFSVVDGGSQYNDIYGFEGLGAGELVPEGLPEFSDCDDTGFPENIGCYLGVAIQRGFALLFIPSDNSIDRFISLKDTFGEKFPFSYFYDIYDLYQTSGSISTTTFSGVRLDLRSAVGTSSVAYRFLPGSIDFFSSTTVNQYMGSGNVAIFKTIMSAILYLLFGSMVFFKIKNEFHHK